MLCNNCGKVLEGKATLCPECKEKGGAWTQTYAGINHEAGAEPSSPSPSSPSAGHAIAQPTPAQTKPELAPAKPRKVPLLTVVLGALVLIAGFYHLGGMRGSMQTQESVRERIHRSMEEGNERVPIDSPVITAVQVQPPPVELSPLNSEGASDSGVGLAIVEQGSQQAFAGSSASVVSDGATSVSEPEVAAGVDAGVVVDLPVNVSESPSILSEPSESTSASDASSSSEESIAVDETIENLVRFGSVRRYFPYSVAFLNPSKTTLRIYLGQNSFDPHVIDELARHSASGAVLPANADLLFILSFRNGVSSDCSFRSADSVQVTVFRTGITGFPLPGRSNSVSLTLREESLAGSTLRCDVSPAGIVRVSGVLDGAGDFSQGEAVYTFNWRVRIDPDRN
jgi:hypothetical protein